MVIEKGGRRGGKEMEKTVVHSGNWAIIVLYGPYLFFKGAKRHFEIEKGGVSSGFEGVCNRNKNIWNFVGGGCEGGEGGRGGGRKMGGVWS